MVLYLRENVDDLVVAISDFANILLVYRQASEAVQFVLQHVFRRNVFIRFIVLKLLSESAVEIGVTRTISSNLETSENVSSSPFSFMNVNSLLILKIALKLSFAYKMDNSHFSLFLLSIV